MIPNNHNQSKLDLRNRDLNKIPAEVYKFKNLRKLDLRNNNLQSIPLAINKLKQLEVLDLSYNKINILHAGIFKLKKLKILILSHNRLKDIPKQIGDLKELRILHLSGNSIINLPENLQNLQKLSELNISNNNFTIFPEVILGITNLKSLWIGSNNFESFPSRRILEKLENLKAIYCFGALPELRSGNNQHYINASKKRGNSLNYLNRLLKSASKTRNIKIMPQVNEKLNKAKIFISYSRQDKEWVIRIKKHLKVAQFEDKDIKVWDDSMIRAGSKWKEEIKNAIKESNIAILVISTDFLASDFIRSDELPPLLKSAEEKGTLILPVIVYPSRYSKTPGLKDFQAVNPLDKPLAELGKGEQESILLSVITSIEEHIS